MAASDEAVAADVARQEPIRGDLKTFDNIVDLQCNACESVMDCFLAEVFIVNRNSLE